MTKMLTSRLSVVLTAALFAAATYMNASSGDRSAPTTMVLAQPNQILDSIAANR